MTWRAALCATSVVAFVVLQSVHVLSWKRQRYYHEDQMASLQLLQTRLERVQQALLEVLRE